MKSNMNNHEQFNAGNSKNSKREIGAPPAQPLLIKELAMALGVSTRFIYQMRACGFPMRGDTRQRQMATLNEARAWIYANNFRLLNGTGLIDATATQSPDTRRAVASGRRREPLTENPAGLKKLAKGRPLKVSGHQPWQVGPRSSHR